MAETKVESGFESGVEPGFEPEIVAFLCNWCSYAGADLAGTSRLGYPANVRAIRVMCSGRIDPAMMIRPFMNGADGVLVLGCHFGDCHYLTGNYQTDQRVRIVWEVLRQVGIDPGRLHLDWVSAAEGARFAEIVEEFCNRIRHMGPLKASSSFSPLPRSSPSSLSSSPPAAAASAASSSSSCDGLALALAIAVEIVEGERFRWLVGRLRELREEGSVYGERIDEARLERLVQDVIAEEYVRAGVRILAAREPLSVKDIASMLGLAAMDVLKQVAYLKKRGVLDIYDVQQQSPRYQSTTTGIGVDDLG
ncbi:MAG: hydrogenase iron-sulfur subunit [Firmicutes bacterium]|nr:hydrogenase iron-sulfur subunit [Bacillota bacterium]